MPVVWDDHLMSQLYEQGARHAFIGLGSIGDTTPRQRLYEKAIQQRFQIVSAIHFSAVVAHSARIGHGVTIMAGTVINPEASLGDNVIVNTGAIIEHDCIIGDHVHIATGARLASTVQVGDGTHIGIGATVRQSITIGRGAVVAAGAVVVADVPDMVILAGVPASILRDLGPALTDAGPANTAF